MKSKEFRKYVLVKGYIPFPLTNETVIAYNSIYDEKSVLLYDHNTNVIAFTKIDRNIGKIIIDNETTVFRIDAVKNKKTFLNYIDSLNAYCIKHNCNHETALNKEAIPESNKDDVVCVQSPTDPNKQIIYCKTNKSIRFLEVHEGSSIIDIEFKCEEKPNSHINENNFDEFAKESFKFCEKNGCSFADYADEIAPDILELTRYINEIAKKNLKVELLNIVFDKCCVQLAFVYYNIYCKKDRTVNQYPEENKEKQKLEKFKGATGEFAGCGHERQ